MGDSAKTIEGFIVSELAAGLTPGSLPHDEDLLAAELIDSVGIVTLVSFLEDHFGITVADHDLTPENFRSVDSIVVFVGSKGG
jgi:acyl carrier protein